MKDKIALYRPILYILLISLLAVTAVTAVYSPAAFYVVAGMSACSLTAAGIYLYRSHRDVRYFIDAMGAAVSHVHDNTAMNFPLPVMIADEEEEIVWYNESCKELFFPDAEWYGRDIEAIIGKQPGSSQSFSITYHGRAYTVFVHRISGMTAYYFHEDTKVKADAAQYWASRPSVFVIMLDSFDEVLADAKENERSSLIARIEYEIEKFASDNDGIVIKTARDRFYIFIEERHMGKILEARFSMLDAVRGLTTGDRLPVTLSVGVARNTASFPEGQRLALQALDMAQGRGGDQVAVKTKNGYDFYGGMSKGVEKRTKVKTRIVATAMREMIESSGNVIIMGHKFADLDALGSAVGMLRAVRQLGKPGAIAIDRSRNLVSPMLERLEKNGYENSFFYPSEMIERVKSDTLLIVVDTHLPHVLESKELYQACKNVVVIDHHRRMVGYIDNAVIFYHEPYASSASEMVTELIQYFGDDVRISRVEAESLLAGIMLDTRNFVIRTGVRTFEAAAYLRRQGADTVEVRKMFSSSMESYQSRSRVVASAEIYHRCAIACAPPNTENIKLVAPQAADELLNISDVDASFVLYEYDGGVTISARSMGKMNVQVVMETLGGGGHQTMAATQMAGASMEDARQKLFEAIETVILQNAADHPQTNEANK